MVEAHGGKEIPDQKEQKKLHWRKGTESTQGYFSSVRFFFVDVRHTIIASRISAPSPAATGFLSSQCSHRQHTEEKNKRKTESTNFYITSDNHKLNIENSNDTLNKSIAFGDGR